MVSQGDQQMTLTGPKRQQLCSEILLRLFFRDLTISPGSMLEKVQMGFKFHNFWNELYLLASQ